jgi:phosphoribosylamine--glycine ligase
MSKLNVLIVGSGGREHALARAVKHSPRCGTLYVAPGNAGTAALGVNLPILADDLDGLVEAARAHGVDLTIVGPEAPLCAGIVDRFKEAGLRIFGPTRAAARIEGDKAYAKQLMHRALVPTAEAQVFDDFQRAHRWVATRDYALVVKAAGLAAGKGVIVCEEPSDALLALEKIMVERAFGDAGNTVVVEERLTGPELSVLALVDGTTIHVLEPARDYKKAGDGDTGPNTGGMGSVSPSPDANEQLMAVVERDIFVPIVDAMRADGIEYHGVLYAGLMLTHAGPKVLEFNCRFGDPETQVVLPRMTSDLLEVLDACASGRLADQPITWDPRHAVCVVVAAGGYPGAYPKGTPMTGLEAADETPDVFVYHAGTTREGDQVVTSGGRVLGVTGLGHSTAEARERAYAAAAQIRFTGAWLRGDIAKTA